MFMQLVLSWPSLFELNFFGIYYLLYDVNVCRCSVIIPVSHTGGLPVWNALEGRAEVTRQPIRAQQTIPIIIAVCLRL